MMQNLVDQDYPQQRHHLSLITDRLTLSNPFLVESLALMNIYIARSVFGVVDIPTAATFGRNIVFNPDFMKTLDDIEIITVLDHEFQHYIQGHSSFNTIEVKPEYRMLLNQAKDFDVNYRLVNFHKYRISNTETLPAKLPLINGSHCCYDTKYDLKWNFLSIFNDLVKNTPVIEMVVLDKHLSQEELEKLKGFGVEVEVNQADVAAQLQRVYQNVKACGHEDSIPDYVRQLLDEYSEPQFNYYDMLHGIVSAQIKEKPSWSTPRRKYLDYGYYLPDRSNGKFFKAGLFFDCSGSISDEELQKMVREYMGLLDQLPAYELHVAAFSTQVHESSYRIFTKQTIDMDWVPTGNGGTDLSCITDFLKEKDIHLDNLIILSDNETWQWPDPDYCENIIFLCTGAAPAPFGKTYFLN